VLVRASTGIYDEAVHVRPRLSGSTTTSIASKSHRSSRCGSALATGVPADRAVSAATQSARLTARCFRSSWRGVKQSRAHREARVQWCGVDQAELCEVESSVLLDDAVRLHLAL
jgi:hypothetical protein